MNKSIAPSKDDRPVATATLAQRAFKTNLVASTRARPALMTPTAGVSEPSKPAPIARAADSAVDWYHHEIRQIPLLSADQEVALAQLVEEGDTAAAAALAQANLRLVVSVACRYQQRGLPLDDLIAEGNLGLLHALQKYDWRLGYRFSTYAIWWIRQAITRALADKGQIIRLPAYAVDAVNVHKRRLDDAPADSLERHETMGTAISRRKLDDEWWEHALAATRPLLSLDQPVNGETDSCLSQVVADAQAVQPEESALQQMLHEELCDLMAGALTARECMVVTRHFGLDGDAPETLQAIGQRLKMTRERVRQIEAGALTKLRVSAAAQGLRAS